MTITIDFKALATALIAGAACVMTATGAIDQYIPFAGELNAAAFCLLTGMTTIMATALSFEIANH